MEAFTKLSSVCVDNLSDLTILRLSFMWKFYHTWSCYSVTPDQCVEASDGALEQYIELVLISLRLLLIRGQIQCASQAEFGSPEIPQGRVDCAL